LSCASWSVKLSENYHSCNSCRINDVVGINTSIIVDYFFRIDDYIISFIVLFCQISLVLKFICPLWSIILNPFVPNFRWVIQGVWDIIWGPIVRLDVKQFIKNFYCCQFRMAYLASLPPHNVITFCIQSLPPKRARRAFLAFVFTFLVKIISHPLRLLLWSIIINIEGKIFVRAVWILANWCDTLDIILDIAWGPIC